MEAISSTIEILNDLVQIHNDRITGYEKAIKELNEDDADLRDVFKRMISQSHDLKMALDTEIRVLGGTSDDSTMLSGKIYRMWMDMRAALSTDKRHSVLANCEFGEDAALKTYESALEDDDLPEDLRELIREQQKTLRSAHDTIKALRNENAQ